MSHASSDFSTATYEPDGGGAGIKLNIIIATKIPSTVHIMTFNERKSKKNIYLIYCIFLVQKGGHIRELSYFIQ